MGAPCEKHGPNWRCSLCSTIDDIKRLKMEADEEAALSRVVVDASLALRPNDKSKYWPIDGGTPETIAWNVAVDKLRAFRERGK